MTRALLTVGHVGPLVTYQDGGRPGKLRFGIPRSGPMDRLAHAAANVALGRPTTATAIEISLGGLSVTCSQNPVTVAVCGGGFVVEHAGRRCHSWTVCTLQPDDVLTVRAGTFGSWCYLAVSGDLEASTWLGSASTHVRSGIGPDPISRGQELVVVDPFVDEGRDGDIQVPNVDRAAPLRAVVGPQVQCFDDAAVDAIAHGTFSYSPAYDRMGVRLDGPNLALADALAIASTPIVRGSIQVAGDGVATLLFSDHQTTGGYPKIATVLADEVDRAAQFRSGDDVRFELLDSKAAIRFARARAAERDGLLRAVAARPGLQSRRLLSANLIDGVVSAYSEV